jgi:hypothetical protein
MSYKAIMGVQLTQPSKNGFQYDVIVGCLIPECWWLVSIVAFFIFPFIIEIKRRIINMIIFYHTFACFRYSVI